MAMNPLQKLGAAAAILASSFAVAVPVTAQDTAPPTPEAMTAPEVQQVFSAEEAKRLSAGRFVLLVGTDFFSRAAQEFLAEEIQADTGYEVLVVRSDIPETWMFVNNRIGSVITDDLAATVAAISKDLAKKADLPIRTVSLGPGAPLNDG